MIKKEKIIKDILFISLGANEREKGLIFYDDYDGDGKLEERIEIVRDFITVSEKFDIKLIEKSVKNSGGNGLEPDFELWKEIFGNELVEKIKKEYGWDLLRYKKISIDKVMELMEERYLTSLPNFVIAMSYFSTSHTYFRKLLNNFGTRYVSMPLFDLKMFEGPLNINFEMLERDTIELLNKISGKKGCLIKNSIGTELSLHFGDRVFRADTGNFRDKGSFGNLPAGEVYIAPIEDKTEGILVIEWAMNGKLKEPLKAEIKKGKVVSLEGDEKSKNFLEEIFSKDERNNCICELGLGTNKGAKRADNILEAEKIYGTAHIAFGDNITFSGCNKASTHIDYVIFNPEVEWY